MVHLVGITISIILCLCVHIEANLYVNFTIIYEEVSTDEIVRLQNAIEDLGYIGDMPVNAISISSPNVPAQPLNVTGTALSDSTINVTWVDNPAGPNLTVLGYTVFYKPYIEVNAPWLRQATGPTPTNLVIRELVGYTTYTIRVVAFHSGGNGIASKYVDEKTREGIPSQAPGNLTCVAMSPNLVQMQWQPINSTEWHGIPTNYTIFYRVFGESGDFRTSSFASYVAYGELDGLTPYKRFEIHFAAATATGFGPKAWCLVKTLEGVPSFSPPITYWELDPVKQNEAFVAWDPISNSDANGDLIGYEVFYGISNDGKTTYAYPVLSSIEVGPYTTSTNISDLPIDVTLTVRVAGVTKVGVGNADTETFIETCTCPKHIYSAWFSNSPYVLSPEPGKVTGIFPTYLQKMTKEICGSCKGIKRGNADQPCTLYWDRSKDGRSPKRKSEVKLKEMVGDNIHFHVAMFGREEIRNFRHDYRFVSIVNSPGIAFIIRDPVAELDKTAAILASLLSCWPAIIIIFMFSLLAGIFIWVLDCESNAKEFPNKSFFNGIYHGAYWAFISMSTVGYGDKTPKSYSARFVTILWMLMGPIINGIVIGAITASLTTIKLEEEAVLYGARVGAINGTFEYNLGIRRNAIMDSTPGIFETKDQLLEALEYREVDGILMDSLAAADLYDTIIEKKLKISKLIDERSGWGIILSSDFVKLEDEVRSYVKAHADEMKGLVNNYTDGKLTIKAVAPGEADTGIVDPESQTFKDLMVTCTVLIVLACLFGLVFDFIILKNRRNKVKPKSKQRFDMLEEDACGVIESFCGNITENLTDISKRHESEMKSFCWKKGYSFGIDGWLRQKTNDETMLKKDIRYQEIMLQDLVINKSNPALDKWRKKKDLIGSTFGKTFIIKQDDGSMA